MIIGLGERLQKERQALHLSQKEVASMLGVSASIISNYENGERTPSIENLISLSRIYRCSIDYLVGIDKTSNNSISTPMLTPEQRSLLAQFLSSLK